MFEYGDDDFFYPEDKMGMTVSIKSVVLNKDDNNLIGISIGGGAPHCPCLYIVQIFDNTPAANDGILESGDELLSINNVSIKGKTKVEVAKMIQTSEDKVSIQINKLNANPEKVKSLDIILKKIKHRMVDNMSSNMADNLGLSRAILCNDNLVKRLEELEGTEIMYKGLVEHARRMLKAHYDVLQSYRSFGDCFMCISTREPQQRASEIFRLFGELHRNFEKDGIHILKQIKPILDDFGTYLRKAIPDTKLTVKRYMDAKFSYLSYCLKVKEMDDEEHAFAALQEPLYRIETGNYEYRLILRCRQHARQKFAKLRTDVLEKMELLESKHANDLSTQLKGLLDNFKHLNQLILDRINALPNLFPIEVDYKSSDFQYKTKAIKELKFDEDYVDEMEKISPEEVTCGVEAVEQPAAIFNISNNKSNSASPTSVENELLLKDLDLLTIDMDTKTSNFNESTSLSYLNQSKMEFDQATGTFDIIDPASHITENSTQSELDLMAVNLLETDKLLQ